ncbi:MAG: hypothetical protein ACE14L_11755 [Terriglobales bacterium]
MTPVGVFALALFVVSLVASLRGWIPQRVLTMQSVLLLDSAIIIAVDVLAGIRFNGGQLLTAANLHPVTSTASGFLFAGALQAAGGFQAAGRLLQRLMRTRLGSPFAVVLLVNFPAIFAMPCGRIMAAPLIPLAVMLGFEVAGAQQNPTVVAMVVFGLLVSAAASCGPSLIGGIGMLGEGMGRFPSGAFAEPNQLAIVVITVVTMAAIRVVYGRTLKMNTNRPGDLPSEAPEHGYLAFGLFVLVLSCVVIFRPKVPLQAVLVVLTLVVVAIARLSWKDLLGSIMLHPLSAMLAGYIVAGALLVSGGFTALEAVLVLIAEHTFLGYTGVGIVLAFVPLVLPMPCGRIVSVSLVPGVLLFGEQLGSATGFALAPAVLLVGFILSGAASCGPSPIGGIGNIGEGRLRIRGYWSGRPQALGIFAGVPIAALLVSFYGVDRPAFDLRFVAASLMVGLVAGLATNVLLNFRPYQLGGIAGGLLVGALMVML